MVLKTTQVNGQGEYVGPSVISEGSSVRTAIHRALAPDKKTGRCEFHLARGQQITLLVVRQD